MTIMKKFNRDFNEIELELTEEQVKAGENGTGYFDGLVHADLGLESGQRAKFTDRHGREGIVLATSIGNVVVFKRYAPGSLEILVHNAPHEIGAAIIPEGNITDDQYGRLSGICAVNSISVSIDRILKVAS